MWSTTSQTVSLEQDGWCSSGSLGLMETVTSSPSEFVSFKKTRQTPLQMTKMSTGIHQHVCQATEVTFVCSFLL